MRKPKLPWVKMAIYFPLCLINIGVGLFFVLLPWMFVIGLPLLVLACWPYAAWMSKHIHASSAYANRDKPLDEGAELPWEEEPDISEDEIMNILINQNGRGKSNG